MADELTGSFDNVDAAVAALRKCDAMGHLIGSATVTQLQPGCVIAISVVALDIEKDTHPTGGDENTSGTRGLLKHALFKLANAVGIAFDPETSGRIDNGRDPRYVHWRAVGAWMQLDGSLKVEPGEKRMDLRDGSDQVDRIYANAKTQERAERTLRDTRAFISEHAETKAQLRAIRKLLALRSYTRDELAKPFFVAKLSYVGHDNNPEIERENKRAMRDRMLGGIRACFGERAAAVQLAAARSPLLLPQHEPPPVGEVIDHEDDEPIDVPAEPSSSPRVAPPATNTSASQTTQSRAARPHAPVSSAGPVAKFGRSKGKPLSTLSDEDLQWLFEHLDKSLTDPSKQRFRAANEKDWNDVQDEMDRRNAPAEASSRTAGDVIDDAEDASEDGIPF